MQAQTVEQETEHEIKQEKEHDEKIIGMINNSDLCSLIIHLSSLNNERNLETLNASYESWKKDYWDIVNEEQRAKLTDIMATAHMLYLDLDGAARLFTENNNVSGLQDVLALGMLYGRYDAVKAIINYGALKGDGTLAVSRSDLHNFLTGSVLPRIALERDHDDEKGSDEFFVREDILDKVLSELNTSSDFLRNIVYDMFEKKSRDSPRKLLLSLYSKDSNLIEYAKREFNSKKGKRKNIDSVVERICSENGFKLVDKIQAGDSDDYYPLSASIYVVEDSARDSRKFVLKENIRYMIDFSSLDGYNLEKELYSDKLNHDGIPKYNGAFSCDGLEFLLIELVEGDTLTKYTAKDNLLEPEKAIGVITQLTEILKYLHSQGIIYADMKDKNVLYNESENGKEVKKSEALSALNCVASPTRILSSQRAFIPAQKCNDEGSIEVKLIDFGMASTRLNKETETSEEFVYEVVSNAEYACPETIMLSRVYKKSDIFQLGIMFYKLLTGKHPFADGKATEEYTQKESELIAFSLANLWNYASFEHPVFSKNHDLKELVSEMLDKDYRKRPNADAVYQRLSNINEKIVGVA